MKYTFALILALIAGFITASAVLAEEYPDRVSTFGDVRVNKGETVGKAVACFGSVTVAGHVTGEAVATFGSVTVLPGGKVDGKAVATFGSVTVMSGGSVGGDAVSVGGGVSRSPGAQIGGKVVSSGFGNWRWRMPRFFGYEGESEPLDILNGLLLGIAFALLAVVITALFPKRVEVIAEAALGQTGLSACYGLLGLVIVVVGGLGLICTCIGIPVAIAGIILSIAGWILGKMAIGLALGRRLGDAVNRPVLSALLAVFIGNFVLALIGLVPLVGGIVAWALALIGFGAVILTGFGESPTWWQDRKMRRAQPMPQAPPPRHDAEDSPYQE